MLVRYDSEPPAPPSTPATRPVATSRRLHADTTPRQTPQDSTGCWLQQSCSLFLGRARAALLSRPTRFSGPLAFCSEPLRPARLSEPPRRPRLRAAEVCCAMYHNYHH